MKLNEIVENEGNITGWVTFAPGFDLLVEHVPKRTLQAMTRKATRTVYRKHQPVEEVDEDLMTKNLAKCILDWRITEEALRRIFALKTGVELDLVSNGGLPCDEDNKVFMLQRAYGFDNFIVRIITDLEELQENETKNSETLSQDS